MRELLLLLLPSIIAPGNSLCSDWFNENGVGWSRNSFPLPSSHHCDQCDDVTIALDTCVVL